MTLQDLQNIQAFMDRVPMTGKEAIGWCQVSAAIQAEIALRTVSPTPKKVAVGEEVSA